MEKLFEAIQLIVKNTSKSYDVSKRGRITKIIDEKHYEVTIQGSTYKIKTGFKYKIGESVLVLFPNGSATDLYLQPNSL